MIHSRRIKLNATASDRFAFSGGATRFVAARVCERIENVSAAETTSPDTRLGSRYGQSREKNRRGRILGISVAAIFAVILVAWVVWATFDGDGSKLEAKDTGHEIVSDDLVEVAFDLTIPAAAESRCIVEALNGKFAVVGWKVVTIPASDQTTRRITEQVRTSEKAVTGLVNRCWLT